MKVLLDEDLPHKLRVYLPGHDVSTVAFLGWEGLKNGELLRAAESSGFEVFVTGDKNLSYQQNLKMRQVAIIVLSAQEWPVISHSIEAISTAIDHAKSKMFQTVDCSSTRFSQ